MAGGGTTVENATVVFSFWSGWFLSLTWQVITNNI